MLPGVSIEKLKKELEFAERLVEIRRKWIEYCYQDMEYLQSDLKRSGSPKNNKRVEEKKCSIEYALENFEVEKEDLKAIKDMIADKEWELCCKNKKLVEQISIFQ